MAEGFLIETPEKNTMSMEEIGNEYFQSLLCNFFFQDVEKYNDGVVWRCKMHDIVHDLARSVVGNHECLIVENAVDIDYISEATRRLNLLVNLNDEEMLPKVLKAVKKAKNLRTVFINNQKIRFDIGNAFKENKRLRVLDLSWSDFTTESSCSSIGGLKHLRYIDVDGACFPKGIGQLNFLQTLSNFDVGDKKKNSRNASVIEELEGLNYLTGDSCINNLQNVTSGTAACRANLKEKKNLRGLQLIWDWRHHDDAAVAVAVLEELRPHPNLTSLRITGFEGSKLPRWIEDSSCLPNLVELSLIHCKCEQVAGFGALPSLRSLTIEKFYNLECLGNELYYSAAGTGSSSSPTIAFPLLKNLNLYLMDSLKEWVVPPQTSTTTNCFPLLEEIAILACAFLTTITPTTTNFLSLKVLDLYSIDGMAAQTLVTNNLNSLTSLRLIQIYNLTSLPLQGLMKNNNTLLSLEIVRCQEFEGFFLTPNKNEEENNQSSSTSSYSSLQSLKLYDCPALRFYPNIGSLTCLRKLEIQDCKESRSLQNDITCLSTSLEQHLEYVKILNINTATAKAEIVFEWRKKSSSLV